MREQLKRTSANSSQPPSQDPPKGFKPSRPNKAARNEGTSSDMRGHGRELYPIEECHSITDPDACWNCGESLEGEDPQPYRHQIVEIPPVVAGRRTSVSPECPGCGCGTRAWNCEILAHGYGVGVVAHVAVLSSLYRHSQRMVQQALRIYLETVPKASTNCSRSEWSSCRGGGGSERDAAAKRRGDG